MEPVLVSLQAGVLRITLNRPDKLNAFNPAVHKGRADAMTRAGNEAAIAAKASPPSWRKEDPTSRVPE